MITTYIGKRDMDRDTVEVHTEGARMSILFSEPRRTGGWWGYSGEDPRMCAEAILRHAYPEQTLEWVRTMAPRFLAKVVAQLPDEWTLTIDQIGKAVKELEAAWAPGRFSEERPMTLKSGDWKINPDLESALRRHASDPFGDSCPNHVGGHLRVNIEAAYGGLADLRYSGLCVDGVAQAVAAVAWCRACGALGIGKPNEPFVWRRREATP